MKQVITQKDLEKRMFELSLQFKTFVTPIMFNYYTKLDQVIKLDTVNPYNYEAVALCQVKQDLLEKYSCLHSQCIGKDKSSKFDLLYTNNGTDK